MVLSLTRDKRIQVKKGNTNEQSLWVWI